MARHVQQAELPLVAGRTPLLELDEETIQVRLPTKVAAAIQADPAAAVKALARKAEEELAKITEANKAIGQKIVDGKLVSEPANEAGMHTGWPVNEDPAKYSSWFVELPPHWKGFYDVTDIVTGTLNTRWWWDGEDWLDGDQKPITHDRFRATYAWRGHRPGAALAWPYAPPYIITELPPGVPYAGKYVRRAAMEA